MMSNIGVICNYYIKNFGSVLQSYALYRYLHNNYENIRLIEYRPIPTKEQGRLIKLKVGSKLLFNKKMLKKKLRSIFDKQYKQKFSELSKSRAVVFKQFTDKYFYDTDKYSSRNELEAAVDKYSTVIVGSDQLWGLVDLIIDYHTLSFVPDGIKKVSYATSFGVKELPEYFAKIAGNFLKRFDYLSVREESGAEIVKAVSDKEAELVADPVLLLSKNEWDEVISPVNLINEKYIFCFLLGNNRQHRAFVQNISNETGYKTVAIKHMEEYVSEDEGFADVELNISSPEDFINLIRFAEYVVCDSFHATVFSTIFNKKFFTLYRYAKNDKLSKNTRIDSILKRLNLSDRIVDGTENVSELCSREIDYAVTNNIIADISQKSKEYLGKALK